MSFGILYGVGLGPGDRELVTLKALRLLRESPVIFYPKRSESDEGISRAIMSNVIDIEGRRLCGLIFPMISDTKKLQEAWDRAAEVIYGELKKGLDAVFVTEGDPLFFSTFYYILNIFKSRYPEILIEIVPGITSVGAASAKGQISLGKGVEQVLTIPASSNLEKVEAEIMNVVQGEQKTLILLKVKLVFDKIVHLIEKHNLSFLFVERCSMPEEIVISDIGKLKTHNPDYFSLIIITT